MIASVASGAVLAALALASGAVAWHFGGRIAANAWIGEVAVGGLRREAAVDRLQTRLEELETAGITVTVEGSTETISTGEIGLDVNLAEAVDRVFVHGHEGPFTARIWQRLTALTGRREAEAPVALDEEALARAVDAVARAVELPRADVRFAVAGSKVTLATDTKAGRVLDRTAAAAAVIASLKRLETAPVALILVDDPPRADAGLANDGLSRAQKMLARPLTLQYEDSFFTVSRDRIGQWLTSEYDGARLVPGLDRAQVASYVTTVAAKLNVDPVPPAIKTDGGRITGFTPSKVGRAVQEDALVTLIVENLMARAEGKGSDTLAVPVKATAMALRGLDDSSGITELIGKATTPFTGSPKNRISNIKNGVKFLSGTVIQPGEEFSTIGTLGVIDNTTGYLPELVIKGSRTTPEFGGGLCQVSTTLFRAVMDAGLPVTERRNHSVRIAYYEKDGTGKTIGPGLDATIYEPDPDFKFRNDTATPVLMIGYVSGDKVTFELYGTKDGRTSQIVGPKLISESVAPAPVYIESTDIPVGTTKQVEQARPGGHTVATYLVTYADGKKNTQTFESWYRRSPAMYLKGVTHLSSPTPAPTPKP